MKDLAARTRCDERGERDGRETALAVLAVGAVATLGLTGVFKPR